MQLGNPLPVFLGIPLMACFCWLIARWVPVLESTPAHNSKTLPLDGLRGILASAVLFHHAYITYGLFHSGHWATPASNLYAQLGPTAVTLFFFISGYLFWRKMLKDPSSLRPSRLLPNRIRRIMPAYLAAVMVFFLLAAWLTHFHRLVSYGSLAFESTSWILGGFPVPGGPVFNTVDPLIVSGGIFWTLQQEWIFYLILPLLVWFRPVLKLLLLAALFFLAQSLFVHVPATSVLAVDIHRLLERFFRMFVAGFTVGMLAAYDISSVRITGILRSPWMTPVAAALVGCHLFLITPGLPMHEPMYESLLLIPVFFMIVNGNDFCGLLSSAPLRCLGAVSYSLYVFHGMILRFLTLTIDRYDPIRLMTPLHYWLWVLPISFVVVLWSTLSYQFIERPFFARRKAVP
jgi:peptidoglycan/LPS O-acetylase OafA/YrhL